MGQTKKRHYDRYTLDYKLQAVILANNPKVRATDIAHSLGIHVVMLYRWQMEYRNGELAANKYMKPKKLTPKRRIAHADSLTAKNEELKTAKKRIKELERSLAHRTEELYLLKKAERFFAQKNKKVIFAFIEKNRDKHKVRRLCALYDVSPSGFYAWLNRPVSAHKCYDEKLKSVIKDLHQGFRRSYGAARLHRECINKGYHCRRINRLMREMGIKASSTGLYAWRPGAHRFYSSTGNQLKEAGAPSQTGTHWAGDFTYIKTKKGWLYHAIILDIYSRKVVGWSFSRQRNAELTKMPCAWHCREINLNGVACFIPIRALSMPRMSIATC